MAYVDNFTDFILILLKLRSGKFIYNYSDKPDLKMNDLIKQIYKSLNIKRTKFYLNEKVGLLGGKLIDIASKLTGYKFSISHIRIKKFISSSIISNKKTNADFPNLQTIDLKKAIDLTIKKDFIKK